MLTDEQNSHNPKAYLIVGRSELPNSLEVGRRFDFESNRLLISNKKEASISIPSKADTTYSVELFQTEEGWLFENHGDPGSVLLNGLINEEHRLKDGDLLQIGNTIFHFLEGVGIQSDIYAQLLRLTRIDLQTGAYNKAHFETALEDWIMLSKRHTQSLSLIEIDIDHFKRVNDTYGHEAGDVVLKQLAERILKRVRKGDVFCRIGGGEEFALILPETPKENAVKFAEEIREEIANEPFVYDGLLLPVTISLGVGEYQEEMSTEEFKKNVDKLLYQAKQMGRNKVVTDFST